MISSGIKRGLAASAVSALAVAGLPLLASSASAIPMSAQFTAPTDSALYTTAPFGVRNDGANTSVHLVASGGADVAQMRFEYISALDTTPVVIGTVSRSNGVFSTEWTPPTNRYGVPVTVTAQPLNISGGEITLAGADDSATGAVDANATTIDISDAPGSAVGVFEAPYTSHTGDWGVVSGTTSELTNPVQLQDQQDGIDDPIDVTAANGGVYGDPANGIRTFKGVANFDVTGGTGHYDYGTNTDADQAVVEAVAGTDDNEAVSLYKQTIKTVTATPANANPPASNATTDVTVTVLDQNGKPVAGAEVVPNDTIANAKYTNANGEAVFQQAGNSTGATSTYTVNTTDTDAYEPAIDYRRSVTVTTYNDSANGITINASKLGNALDFGEYANDPVSVTVLDNAGNPRNGQVLNYAWTVDKFTPASDPSAPAGSGTVTTGTDGKQVIPAPSATNPGVYTLNTWIEKDGNPGQSSGDLQAAPLDVKMGNASIVWADGTTAQAKAGTTKQFDGTMEIEDGTGLAGREVTFSYTPGTETVPAGAGDSIVSATQPTGTTRINNNSAKDVTDASGVVSVSLTDPAETTQPNEMNADLNAASSGDAADADATNAANTLDIDWLKNDGPTTAADIDVNVQKLIEGLQTPGRPVDLDINVQNSDDVDLTDYPVSVTVDHGFLSPDFESADGKDANSLVPDPAPAQGAKYGEWKDLGTSKSLTTDDSGDTGIVAAIEKDAGFDTSSTVTTTLKVTAGNVTKDVTVVWTSQSPLNGGDVKIERDDQQTITVLPKAPTSESAKYNVFTTDQFGNLVDNVPVAISDDAADAHWNTTDVSPVNSQLKNEAAALTLSATAAGDQTVTGSWIDAPTATWDDTNPLPTAETWVRKNGTKTLTGKSEAVQWYVIDYATSTYSLTHTGADTQPVGTTVTETYTAKDQNGEPISDLFVQFFRSGPDNLQDGDGNYDAVTGPDGSVQYVFQGSKAGKATTTATARMDDKYGDVVGSAEKTDVVNFAYVKRAIVAKLIGQSNAGKADVLSVDAPSSANGATVRLFKIVNGVRHLVSRSHLNGAGNHTFTVADKNGKGYTKYVAVVSPTARTKGDGTNPKTVR